MLNIGLNARFSPCAPRTGYQSGTIYEGTSNMQLQTIAKNLLR